MKILHLPAPADQDIVSEEMSGLVQYLEDLYGGYGSGTAQDMAYNQINDVPYAIEIEMGMVLVLIPT